MGKLQRSPALAGRDRRRSSTGPSPWTCFNGAPPSRAGIVARHLLVEAERRMLQRSPALAGRDRCCRFRWSRRIRRFNGAPPSRAGIGCCRLGWSAVLTSFNGAPPSRAGIARCAVAVDCRPACFNGAPPSRAGIAAESMSPATSRWRLQRSPALAGRDRDDVEKALSEWLTLQRSPALAGRDRAFTFLLRPRPPRFNGAPPSRAGIEARLRLGPYTEHRFNGAPPSRAGIARRCDCAPRRPPCFNGAPPSRAGIALARIIGCHPRGASTEPRPRGQGSQPRRLRSLRRPVLQRSPALAGRDRRGPGAGGNRNELLQRSPALAGRDRVVAT